MRLESLRWRRSLKLTTLPTHTLLHEPTAPSHSMSKLSNQKLMSSALILLPPSVASPALEQNGSSKKRPGTWLKSGFISCSHYLCRLLELRGQTGTEGVVPLEGHHDGSFAKIKNMQQDELKEWAMVGDASAALACKGLSFDHESMAAKIAELEDKLASLHATDLNSLKRANRTLGQHAQALRIESQHLTSAINNFETDVVTLEFAAREGFVLSAVISGSYLVERLITKARFDSPRRMLVLISLGIAGWRLFTATTDRLRRMREKNKATKELLMRDWRLVDDRIGIMNDLVRSTPP
jgi:prefoldin subunit 5